MTKQLRQFLSVFLFIGSFTMGSLLKASEGKDDLESIFFPTPLFFDENFDNQWPELLIEEGVKVSFALESNRGENIEDEILPSVETLQEQPLSSLSKNNSSATLPSLLSPSGYGWKVNIANWPQPPYFLSRKLTSLQIELLPPPTARDSKILSFDMKVLSVDPSFDTGESFVTSPLQIKKLKEFHYEIACLQFTEVSRFHGGEFQFVFQWQDENGQLYEIRQKPSFRVLSSHTSYEKKKKSEKKISLETKIYDIQGLGKMTAFRLERGKIFKAKDLLQFEPDNMDHVESLRSMIANGKGKKKLSVEHTKRILEKVRLDLTTH